MGRYRRSIRSLLAVITIAWSASQGDLGVVVAFSSSSGSLTRQLENLLDEHGALRDCKIGTTKYGRGLVATKDLNPGDVALRIPRSCALIEEDPNRDEDEWTGRLAHRLDQLSHNVEQASARNPVLDLYTRILPQPPDTPCRGDWPQSILDQELDDPYLLQQIRQGYEWRYQQWNKYGGGDRNDDSREEKGNTASKNTPDCVSFLDALDLVCSRTVRIKSDVMLIPLLDMANHASEPEGGGYFEKDSSTDSIILCVGQRGVRTGEEVTLNYGSRSNEEWLMHYGFLPYRNPAESVILTPRDGVATPLRVTWDDVRTNKAALRQACLERLREYKTSLENDWEILRRIREAPNTTDNYRLELALQYRINQKTLLSAVSGENLSAPRASSYYASAFANF